VQREDELIAYAVEKFAEAVVAGDLDKAARYASAAFHRWQVVTVPDDREPPGTGEPPA
jgi:hypothetical protein